MLSASTPVEGVEGKRIRTREKLSFNLRFSLSEVLSRPHRSWGASTAIQGLEKGQTRRVLAVPADQPLDGGYAWMEVRAWMKQCSSARAIPAVVPAAGGINPSPKGGSEQHMTARSTSTFCTAALPGYGLPNFTMTPGNGLLPLSVYNLCFIKY